MSTTTKQMVSNDLVVGAAQQVWCAVTVVRAINGKNDRWPATMMVSLGLIDEERISLLVLEQSLQRWIVGVLTLKKEE